MSEPTGQRIDGTPWEEARPPHLPDRLIRTSPWVFAFAIAALVQVWSAATPRVATDATPTVEELAYLVQALVPSIAASLLGAALFLRHPSAWRTVPVLVVGLVLFVVGELLGVVDQPFARFLADLAPATDPTSVVTPLGLAWSVLTTSISILAVTMTAGGLSRARRRPVVLVARPLAVALTIVSIVIVLLSVSELLGTVIAPSLAIASALGVALGLASNLAWAYLVVVTATGWMAGESPRRGWALAAAAATLFFAIRIVTSIAFDPGLAQQIGTFLVILVGWGAVLAWLLLLVAFVVGLPATDDRPAATRTGSAGS